ncbi:MAG: phytanoyl-CoA dioxygenase family protein [Alphaproteobacteria bacterium]|nr:phytanoyl-CoA dioxygenase family protein [Alphaproteobacteria bacterium]
MPEGDAAPLPVPAGHFSLHHTHLVHASAPNRSAGRRIGFGISYIPTRVRHTSPIHQTAMLVRGEDCFGHFDPETPPVADFDAAARAFHAQYCTRLFGSHGSARTEGEVLEA